MKQRLLDVEKKKILYDSIWNWCFPWRNILCDTDFPSSNHRSKYKSALEIILTQILVAWNIFYTMVDSKLARSFTSAHLLKMKTYLQKYAWGDVNKKNPIINAFKIDHACPSDGAGLWYASNILPA